MEKAAIFIDGGYLNRIMKNYFDEADINYVGLCNEICEELKLKRLRTYYYNCLPIIRRDNKEDERRHSKMQLFFVNLRRLPRFEVRLGKLQLVGGQFKQKMIDVLMSLDIVDICFKNRIQHVIIIAGDSDFVPAIKRARDYGTIVHLFYHPKSVHNELLDEIDEFHLISEELISKCKK